MTAKTQRQIGLLAVLVAVFVTIMFVGSRGEGPAGRAGGPVGSGGRAAPQATVGQVADVNLEALRQDREAPSDPQRNLFAFQQRAAPRPQPTEAPPPVEMPAPVPTGPPPPPPISLKFIGVLDAAGAGGKVAILSDGRGSTFYAREGQDVDGRYRILKIGAESVELSYVDGRGRQTLRLSGQ